MKILHTADWHLGKSLKGQSLLEDQAFIINQLFDVIDEQKPDAILICGDIYDRNIPPAAAVELLSDTLTRFAEKNLPTFIIAGNHDSATRLNFGSKIFERQDIYIAANVAEDPVPLVLEDKFGEIYFSLVPYFEPGEIKAKFFDENTERINYNAANQFYVDLSRKKIPCNKRSVALAHVFLTGGVESDSERKFVGGAANVDAQIFGGYDYVALGHLHRPQKISAENIRYAGSPLKYSFDEANHKKSITLVELDGRGFVKAEPVILKPRRDVKIVKGTLHEMLRGAKTDDYICAKLTERVINVQDKLANVFPNLLSVEFDLPKKNLDVTENISQKNCSTLDYFADFFQLQTGEPLNNKYREAMGEFLDNIYRGE